MFAGIASTYFRALWRSQCGHGAIAAKNHRNGMTNPYAQFRKDLGFEFCNTVSDKNPYVAIRFAAPTARWSPMARPHW